MSWGMLNMLHTCYNISFTLQYITFCKSHPYSDFVFEHYKEELLVKGYGSSELKEVHFREKNPVAFSNFED